MGRRRTNMNLRQQRIAGICWCTIEPLQFEQQLARAGRMPLQPHCLPGIYKMEPAAPNGGSSAVLHSLSPHRVSCPCQQPAELMPVTSHCPSTCRGSAGGVVRH